MSVFLPALVSAAFSLLAACSSNSPDGERSAIDDPESPGVAFAQVPASATVNGLFQVWVRINDIDGLRFSDDSNTVITVSASGGGTLHGTLSRRVTGGLAIFDDLSYDRWESIKLTASSNDGVLAPVTMAAALPVRPLLRFVELPPAHVPAGHATGPFRVELVDGQGQRLSAEVNVSLTSRDPSVVIPDHDRSLATGVAVWDAVDFPKPGSVSLVFKADGLGDLIHGVSVHDGTVVSAIWLPGARVGVPYLSRVDLGEGAEAGGLGYGFNLLSGALPRGLRLDAVGEIIGIPAVSELGACEIFGVPGEGPPRTWRGRLPVFPETEKASEPLDGMDRDGPFTVDHIDEPLAVKSRGVTEPMRILFPRDPAGAIPAGRMPLVVFHHGVAPVDALHPTLYDRFDHFLHRWASHGFVVVTIDAVDLAWSQGRLVGASLANLTAMSENQRAAIVQLRADDARADHLLAGHVDADRVIVAGHSRGGGASLITAATEPSVIGGILIKPLDPMATTGGEHIWNTRLPRKPFLMVVAGSDGDVPYPMVDFLYERRSAPMSAPTIMGTGHFSSCNDLCPDEPDVVPEIPRGQDWAITNAYAVAFLKYVAQGELGYAPLLFGGDGVATRLSTSGVLRRSDSAMDALVIDDFQEAGAGHNRLGLASAGHDVDWSADEPSLVTASHALPDDYAYYRLLYDRPDSQVWSGAHRLTWSHDGAGYGFELAGLDVRGRASFVFRARTDDGPLAGTVSLRLVDDGNREVVLPVVGAIGPRFGDVIVPLGALAAAGVNPASLARGELVLGGAGSMLIDDLRFE